MANIKEKYLQQLRDAGLFACRLYSPTHALPDGVRIGKPTSTPGNHIPDYIDSGYIVISDFAAEPLPPLPPDMDAPMVVLYSRDDAWWVYSYDFIGGLMPSDFHNEWPTPEQAVADILDLYFGDPKRMQAKAESKMSRRPKM
jgi:hypothetical protein